MMILFFLQNRLCLKSINHRRKILDLVHPEDDWFKNAICYSRLADLCDVAYKPINHGMYATFAERRI